MTHIAIMKKSWKLLPKIISGEKTIETRWYKNKYKPWNCIHTGDTIYFKDSGEPVTVKAEVSNVKQYNNLAQEKTEVLLKKYGRKDLGIDEIPKEISKYVNNKKYAIIIYINNPKLIKPFDIDKTGYGAMASWLCVEDICKVKIPLNSN